MLGFNKQSLIDREIKEKYGSRKGLLYSWLYKILNHFGFYKKHEAIDWRLVNRLVFVCKGNICRSAYAGNLVHSPDIESISFGLDTIDGALANDKAILTAQKFGHNLQNHRTTSFKSMVFNDFDLLIAMEPEQLNDLITKTENRYQYTLLGLWCKDKLPYINDPYNTVEQYYENCFKAIEDGVNTIIEKTRVVRN